MAEIGVEAILDRLSGWRLSPADAKALRYVGKFFNHRRLGARIVAEVEGNHGTYTVSIDAGTEQPESGCSCYIGAGGGCHHVRALAQTFLDASGSFVAREVRGRGQVRTLEDLANYLETTTLESLLSDLQAQSLSRQSVGRVLGAGRRTLSEAVQDEKRNAPDDGAGALKLACLYLLEWGETAARNDDLTRALSGRSRRELVDLMGELVGQLSPVARQQFFDRLGPVVEARVASRTSEGELLLAEIDRFVLDCESGLYYEPDAVEEYRHDYSGEHDGPDLKALDLLEDFLLRTEQLYQAGEHALAVAAYSKLHDVIHDNTDEWFGVDEISGWLETDLTTAMSHYLASLSQICPPEEYVKRAWERVGWSYSRLLITESGPEQLRALEAHLLGEVDAEAEEANHMPLSLDLLRRLYAHQGRDEEDQALCLRWRSRYPELFTPLMDRAEQAGDWTRLEELAREALSVRQERERTSWWGRDAGSKLERRLSLALERQGDLEGALTHARTAFEAQPDFGGYRHLCALAERISGDRRAKVGAGLVDFLRQRVSPGRMSPYDTWSSPEAELLARVLLAEGLDQESYDLAMAVKGATQISLLTIVGNFYLVSGWGGRPTVGSAAERALSQDRAESALPEVYAGDGIGDEALSRAGECYHRLVQIYVEARGRDNYATAASYAAVMRDIYTRRGRRADFDLWYVELVDTYVRFRALREEFRGQLGQEPRLGPLSA